MRELTLGLVLVCLALFIALFMALDGYSEAIAAIQEGVAQKERIRIVAIREVPIPPVYNVTDIDNYCRSDYTARMTANGT